MEEMDEYESDDSEDDLTKELVRLNKEINDDGFTPSSEKKDRKNKTFTFPAK